MRHISRYNLFEEVNPRDISEIESKNDYFTISFEFEIETQDKSNIHLDFTILEDDDIVEDIKSIVKTELRLRKRKSKQLVDDLIDSLLEMTNDGIVSNEDFYHLFDEGAYDNIEEMEIAGFTKSILLSHISGEDLEYLIEKAKQELPNFTKKWGDYMDFVEDATLERGIEIKPKTFVVGISKGIEMINDFYDDLSKQNYWEFSSRTGLHINIGVNSEKVDWNPIKGILMINDFKSDNSLPFVFKNMDWRYNNNFCGSVMTEINKMNPEEKEELKKSLDMKDVNSVELIFSEFLTRKIKDWGMKNFGFNLLKLEHNYVEFRYVGGEIDKNTLIEKLKYFCFVAYAMTNDNYKKNEYLKKLYKFVDNL